MQTHTWERKREFLNLQSQLNAEFIFPRPLANWVEINTLWLLLGSHHGSRTSINLKNHYGWINQISVSCKAGQDQYLNFKLVNSSSVWASAPPKARSLYNPWSVANGTTKRGCVPSAQEDEGFWNQIPPPACSPTPKHLLKCSEVLFLARPTPSCFPL